MYYPDGDPVGISRIMHQQTSYDFVVLTKDTRVIQDMLTTTLYDSKFLMKDTRDMQSLLIDGDQ